MQNESFFSLFFTALAGVTGKFFSWAVLIVIGLPLALGIYLGISFMQRKFLRIKKFSMSPSKWIDMEFDTDDK